jgi:hypothetical protein
MYALVLSYLIAGELLVLFMTADLALQELIKGAHLRWVPYMLAGFFVIGWPVGAVADRVGNRCGAISGNFRVAGQAARSIGWSMSLVAKVCQPSTLRMPI